MMSLVRAQLGEPRRSKVRFAPISFFVFRENRLTCLHPNRFCRRQNFGHACWPKRAWVRNVRFSDVSPPFPQKSWLFWGPRPFGPLQSLLLPSFISCKINRFLLRSPNSVFALWRNFGPAFGGKELGELLRLCRCSASFSSHRLSLIRPDRPTAAGHPAFRQAVSIPV